MTKRAAVAFAEWVAITHGDQGIQVACLCPMMVRTPMLEAFGVPGADTDVRVGSLSAILEPEEVADAALDGLSEGRFLILPHADVFEHFRRKACDCDRWLGGMRRLQRPLAPWLRRRIVGRSPPIRP